MKSKNIEIEIASPNLTDELIEEMINIIKSAINDRFITNNLAFDITVKETRENNTPIFPQYPYKEFPSFPNEKKGIDYPPSFPNKIMCKSENNYSTNKQSVNNECCIKNIYKKKSTIK